VNVRGRVVVRVYQRSERGPVIVRLPAPQFSGSRLLPHLWHQRRLLLRQLILPDYLVNETPERVVKVMIWGNLRTVHAQAQLPVQVEVA